MPPAPLPNYREDLFYNHRENNTFTSAKASEKELIYKTYFYHCTTSEYFKRRKWFRLSKEASNTIDCNVQAF